MASDNILLLTYTTPLALASTYTSPAVLISDYYYLSVVAKIDQNTTMNLEFSGDGSNWDYAETSFILANVNTNITQLVLAKWTRMKLINTGLGVSVELRVYVYGTRGVGGITTSPSGTQDVNILNQPIGVMIKDINATALDEILVQAQVVETSFSTDLIKNGPLFAFPTTNGFQSPYQRSVDILTYGSYIGPIASDGDVFADGAGTGCISISGNTVAPIIPSWGLITRYVTGNVGCAYEMKFTACWNIKSSGFMVPNIVGLHNINGINACGYNNKVGGLPVPTLTDGFGFGYWPATDHEMPFVGPLQIIWYTAGLLMAVIPQSLWNVDPADGSGKLPPLVPTEQTQYKISYAYGLPVIRFSIMNPSDGKYYPVHYIYASKPFSNICSKYRLGAGVWSDPLYNFCTDSSLWRVNTTGWALSSTRPMKTEVPRGISTKAPFSSFQTLLSTNMNATRIHLLTLYNDEGLPYLNYVKNTTNYYIYSITIGYNAGANSNALLYQIQRNDNLMLNGGVPLLFTNPFPDQQAVGVNKGTGNTPVGTSGTLVGQFWAWNQMSYTITGEALCPNGSLHMGPNCSYSLFVSAPNGNVNNANVVGEMNWAPY